MSATPTSRQSGLRNGAVTMGLRNFDRTSRFEFQSGTDYFAIRDTLPIDGIHLWLHGDTRETTYWELTAVISDFHGSWFVFTLREWFGFLHVRS